MPRPNVEVQRRGDILDAACTTVCEKGFVGLRVADVARLAGTSTGTVHYYFETKNDLLRAAFEWNFAQSLARRLPLLEAPTGPRERLHAFVGSYLPDDAVTVRAWHVWAELWVAALHDRDLQDLNERIYGDWRRTVAGIVVEGQAAGIFRSEDPVVVADAIIGMIDGLAMQVLLRSAAMTPERMWAVCARTLRDLEVDATG